MLTLCILFALFTPVNASHNSLSLKSIYLILSIPGNLLYLTLLSLYDYNQAKIAFDYYRNRNMNINTFKSKLNILLLMGPLYLITIITGVFSTNGVWFTIKHYSNPLIFALTTIITLISAMIWHNLASKPANINNLVLNSIFRSMSELICFNSICLSTYCLWEGWTKLLSNIISLNLVYIISIIFILPYIFFSYHMIKSEIYMGPSLVYGVLYYISYTCAIICTNGIFNLFLAHNFSNTFYLLVTISGALITSILHPNFYRNGGYNGLLSTIIDTIGFSNLRRNNHIYIISKLIEFFILFL